MNERIHTTQSIGIADLHETQTFEFVTIRYDQSLITSSENNPENLKVNDDPASNKKATEKIGQRPKAIENIFENLKVTENTSELMVTLGTIDEK